MNNKKKIKISKKNIFDIYNSRKVERKITQKQKKILLQRLKIARKIKHEKNK